MFLVSLSDQRKFLSVFTFGSIFMKLFSIILLIIFGLKSCIRHQCRKTESRETLSRKYSRDRLVKTGIILYNHTKL